jgi:hypothetical protein
MGSLPTFSAWGMNDSSSFAHAIRVSDLTGKPLLSDT